MAEIRELADLVDEHGFTDFEFENENIRVRLSKQPASQFVQGYPTYQNAPVQMSAPAVESKAGAGEVETTSAEIDSDAGLHKITSPIVGTFYRSPSPDKEPYIKEGSNVSADTVVCIIEAMKLMNEIEAEVPGEVVKIYVENGQPVEYGQPLFGIKK
ncbi:MAG: acetyl-CoA carboxylase biotin carboxyl carrier protein [Pyrinomonadaceae bacterium]